MDKLMEFLFINDLMFLSETLNDQGADLDFLLMANDHELSTLVPAIVAKGKLRMALDKERERRRQENILDAESVEFFVAAPQRQSCFAVPSTVPSDTTQVKVASTENSSQCQVPSILPLINVASTSGLSQELQGKFASAESNSPYKVSTLPPTTPITVTAPVAVSSSGFSQELRELEIHYEDAISSSDLAKLTAVNSASLKHILEATTIGKPLLGKQVLSSKDRKVLAALIVEAEVRKLKSITDPIRKEVWNTWTSEITQLFPGETKGVYYSPFRLIDGRVIQASGLILNRLITIRRKLNIDNRRRSKSCSSDSGSSGTGSGKKKRKTIESTRVRPLPDFFEGKNQPPTENQDLEKENLEWLKFSSSPRDLVDIKWRSCLRARMTALQESDHVNYFGMFPALQCSWGYELLASDFGKIYPEAEGKFEEKFPIVKGRLLSLLDEKAQ